MLGLIRVMKFTLAMVVAVGMLALAPSPSRAETGQVALKITRAGFIVGLGGGSGTLRFQGHSYPLSIGGVSVGATIGASSTELIGRAYNMRQASDIAGTYTAVGAGVAVAGGAGAVRLRNSRGVVLELQGRKIGLEFSVDLNGMQISMR